MKKILLTIIFLLFTVNAYSELTLALDYENDLGLGLLDTIESFEYDTGAGVIHVNTLLGFICMRDGINIDRFQETVEIRLNGDWVGTLKQLTYDLANGIIYIETNEINITCEII